MLLQMVVRIGHELLFNKSLYLWEIFQCQHFVYQIGRDASLPPPNYFQALLQTVTKFEPFSVTSSVVIVVTNVSTHSALRCTLK